MLWPKIARLDRQAEEIAAAFERLGDVLLGGAALGQLVADRVAADREYDPDRSCLSAGRGRHPGGRDPAHKQTSAAETLPLRGRSNQNCCRALT